MTHADLYLPFPELCDPRPGAYRIVDAAGDSTATRLGAAVNKVTRWMRVPLDDGGRGVARHELGHVAWSPVEVPKLPFDPRIYATVEDARINLGLAAVGLPVELGVEQAAFVVWLLAEDGKRGDSFALFVRGIASLGTSIEAPLRAQLEGLATRRALRVVHEMDHVREDLLRSARRAGRAVAPHAASLRLSKRLVRTLHSECLLDLFDQADSKLAFGCCAAHEDPEADPATGLLGHSSPPDPPPAQVRPGRLRVVQARLELPQRSGRGPLRWRPAREGSVVRHVDRWAQGGAIFRAKRPRRGGTLLIDTSGSMALTAEDLEKLLARAPIGTCVAIYSGQRSEGELRIVADGGRRARAEQLERFGTGNVVDLPALEWLAKRPLPRIWVSDGAVTGVGDRACGELSRSCQAIARQGRIRRVPRLGDAARLLGSGSGTGS
jgi:hypothetical protein